MSTPKNYYVYLILDPISKQPFYVGKGKGDRAKTHLRPSNLKGNTLKINKIKSIQSQNLEPEIQYVAKNLTEKEAWDLEAIKICEYGRIDLGTGILCNHSDGGEGPTKRTSWNKGKKFSVETRKKMSESRKNSKKAMESTFRNLSKMILNNTGKNRPEHSKFLKENNPNKSKVILEDPILWVNKKTGHKIFGTRYDVLSIDPSVKIHQLGIAMKGKYAHRGWIAAIFLSDFQTHEHDSV
jgi:hypothetical protein